MVKRPDKAVKPEKSQLDKFKEAAKQVETDDSEERFDRALKKVAAKTKPPQAKARSGLR